MKKSSSPVLTEAKRLWDLGFAIHWLRDESKVPLESGWTTGPRKSWEYLKKTYSPGLNIGVRLGTPSLLKNCGYLAVIDVDVKSEDPRHRKEAVKKAKELLGAAIAPEVRSGRGNGSRHYYVVTEKPFKTWNPFTSSEKVKALIPSKQPSKKDRETLSDAEITQGYRMANAWEISLYSDGRQVVLPPSIHPDTKRPYFWVHPFEDPGNLPLISFGEPEKKERVSKTGVRIATQDVLEDFEESPVDLDWLSVSAEMKSAIIEGIGVTDRSGYLLPATRALISAGLTKNEILTVLTDPDTFLGECAYDHAKTKSRTRAALWLWNYTVKKVMAERDPKTAFLEAPVDRDATPEEQAEQSAEWEDDPESRGFYHKGKNGALKPDYPALLRVFETEKPFRTIADMKSVFTFNGTHYEDITPIEVKGFAERMFKPAPEDKIRNEFYSKVLANNITRRAFFTETTEGKVNFKNGVLDLSEPFLGLQPHSPALGFRGVLPFEYEASAQCPVFKEWLSGVMLGDRQLMRLLQEYMGYIVRGGEYKYHKALWLGGVGRNGKSTFVDLLKALIGHGNYSVSSIKALVGDKFASSDLDGKIANFSEETSPQELSDSGPFKNLTGDGDLMAQKKFGDLYSFRNRAKLVMTYNQIPDLKDLTAGMLSRPLIVPFRKIIKEGEQDAGIKEKLFRELPGIFNFALRGWHRLDAQGAFTESHASKRALRKVTQESCSVYQWVENHVRVVEEDETISQFRFRAHQLYSIYAKHERFPFREIEFYRRLNAHPEIRMHHKRDKNGQVYWGINID